MRPVVAITVGDYNGVGPEVVLKSLRARPVRSALIPLLVGPPAAFAWYAGRLRIPFRWQEVPPDRQAVRAAWHAGRIPVCPPPEEPSPGVRPGHLSARAGRTAAEALRAAVALVQAGVADGITTAPVSKKALHRAGVRFPGQTEIVQHLAGGDHVAMMLVCPSLRVGLATIHLPLKEVAQALDRRLLRERITTIEAALRLDWGIRKPSLAVLGLNPHAGEQGDLGDEEQRIIAPVLTALRRRGMRLDGPFPADAFFARYAPGTYDAVVAMYHDQGLIPLKMRAAGRGVNVSVGLPVVRTSPDHGTAFDIAGAGRADPSGTIEAILLAALCIRNRMRTLPSHP